SAAVRARPRRRSLPGDVRGATRMTRSTASPDFDRRVADWLETDPDHAPEPVLETVLAAVPSIPQRHASRMPWRATETNRFALLGATAVVAIVLIGGALLLRPGQATVAGPSNPPLTSPQAQLPSTQPSVFATGVGQLAKAYSSTRYGYAMQIPADWTV